MNAILEQLKQLRIVPVIVIDDPVNAAPLAAALIAGGLPCAEITFRTPKALDALNRITAEQPDMFAGAGTVLTPEQAKSAHEAGARFVVAPGFNPRVVEYCLSHDIPVFPGVCTPTEIEMALTLGLTTLKFFPAEPMGGVSYLKAVAAPYTMIDFIPTGGINSKNIGEYLAFKKVLACGGSWMAPADWIAARAWERISAETTNAVATVHALSGAAQ